MFCIHFGNNKPPRFPNGERGGSFFISYHSQFTQCTRPLCNSVPPAEGVQELCASVNEQVVCIFYALGVVIDLELNDGLVGALQEQGFGGFTFLGEPLMCGGVLNYSELSREQGAEIIRTE